MNFSRRRTPSSSARSIGETIGTMIPASTRSVTTAVAPDGVMAGETNTLGVDDFITGLAGRGGTLIDEREQVVVELDLHHAHGITSG